MVYGFFFSGCVTFEWNNSQKFAESGQYEFVGTVEVEKTVWNVLFLKSSDKRRAELLTSVRKKARETYGDDIYLDNVEISSRWSPLSLLLSFDALGFAERSMVRADVLKATPPSEPEPEPVIVVLETPPVTVTYPISPPIEYKDQFGYVGLEYLTQDQVIETTVAKLKKNGSDSERIDTATQKIPSGGHLLVHLGRQDLMHANTKWYSFQILRGDKVVFEKSGEEGIPNVKGKDGNWWNVITLPLREEIDDSINIQIRDNHIDLIYDFTVSRIER